MKDLSNKTYYFWTYMSLDIEKSSGSRFSYWNARCRCGVEKSVRPNTSKSCGCYKVQKNSGKMVGKTFGRWGVLRISGERTGSGQVKYVCKCSCGEVRSVRGADLIAGKSVSCGCYKSECLSVASVTHGMSNTRFYRIWYDMKRRCQDEDRKSYGSYGGRGINVCDRWSKFENFYNDMFESYEDNLTIERIDVNGDYEPSNCEWISLDDQHKNKQDTLYVVIHGKKMRLLDAAEKYSTVKYGAVYHRITKLGWTDEDAIFTPHMR